MEMESKMLEIMNSFRKAAEETDEKAKTHEELIPVNDQAHHVQLKDIINKNWNPVFNTLEQAANSVIDRQWCKEYLDAWHNQII